MRSSSPSNVGRLYDRSVRINGKGDGVRVAFEPVIIENVYPELDCGRYPVKREVSDSFEVWADLFKEGHDVLAAVLKYREKGASGWSETPMRFHENDRWRGGFLFSRKNPPKQTNQARVGGFVTWGGAG